MRWEVIKPGHHVVGANPSGLSERSPGTRIASFLLETHLTLSLKCMYPSMQGRPKPAGAGGEPPSWDASRLLPLPLELPLGRTAETRRHPAEPQPPALRAPLSSALHGKGTPSPQQAFLQPPQGLPRRHQLLQLLLDHGSPLRRRLLHYQPAVRFDQGQLGLLLREFSQQLLKDTHAHTHIPPR